MNKNTFKITESKLKSIIKEAVNNAVASMDENTTLCLNEADSVIEKLKGFLNMVNENTFNEAPKYYIRQAIGWIEKAKKCIEQ